MDGSRHFFWQIGGFQVHAQFSLLGSSLYLILGSATHYSCSESTNHSDRVQVLERRLTGDEREGREDRSGSPRWWLRSLALRFGLVCLLLLRKPLKTVKLVLMLAFLCLQWLSKSVGLSAIILVRAVNLAFGSRNRPPKK